MIITYQGDDYFKLQSGQLTVLIDPVNQRSFKGATAIVNTVRPAKTQPSEEGGFWIDHQGEFEVQGIHVTGVSLGEKTEGEKTAYRVVFDDIVFGILGYCAKEPESRVQELLQECDVLILPGSGKPFIPIEAAAKLVRQLEPSVIIPSLGEHYKVFLKELGQEKTVSEEKFVFKKKELPLKAMAIRPLVPKKS